MKKEPKPCDKFIIDTYSSGMNSYHPGVILYSGRKRRETIQWRTKRFATLQKANGFVRDYCSRLGLQEASNESELISNSTR